MLNFAPAPVALSQLQKPGLPPAQGAPALPASVVMLKEGLVKLITRMEVLSDTYSAAPLAAPTTPKGYTVPTPSGPSPPAPTPAPATVDTELQVELIAGAPQRMARMEPASKSATYTAAAPHSAAMPFGERKPASGARPSFLVLASATLASVATAHVARLAQRTMLASVKKRRAEAKSMERPKGATSLATPRGPSGAAARAGQGPLCSAPTTVLTLPLPASTQRMAQAVMSAT